MPHINRIRVNNVKYNFGTQAYDDLVMKPFCGNMLYDLANGGGKSVLMLLLLQNVIPNCTLDEKQPIEKLFRGNDSSKTCSRRNLQIIPNPRGSSDLFSKKCGNRYETDHYTYTHTGCCKFVRHYLGPV